MIETWPLGHAQRNTEAAAAAAAAVAATTRAAK